jgi:hypothetical protein
MLSFVELGDFCDEVIVKYKRKIQLPGDKYILYLLN